MVGEIFSPNLNFLRATILAARRLICTARTLLSRGVRPSVRHTPVLSLNGEIYLKAFFDHLAALSF